MKFCHNCGKNVIMGANFCPSCGVSLASLSAKPTPPPEQEQKKPGQFTPFVANADDDDPDSYIDKMEHIQVRQQSLQVEIVKDMPIGETFGAVITQGLASNTPPSIDVIRPGHTTDKEAFLKDFQKEAGTIRHE